MLRRQSVDQHRLRVSLFAAITDLEYSKSKTVDWISQQGSRHHSYSVFLLIVCTVKHDLLVTQMG